MTITTLIDANIWIDLTDESKPFFKPSVKAVTKVTADEPSIMSAIVWAELVAGNENEADAERVYGFVPFRREAFPFAAAYPAGQAHRLYRQRGGLRERTLPDFLIGAHALVAGHRLLTRDPARYRSYFPDLVILEPEGSA